jgi:hypothetical protein
MQLQRGILQSQVGAVFLLDVFGDQRGFHNIFQ